MGRRDREGVQLQYLDDYKQAESIEAHVRKGEHGSLVVYADRLTRTESNEKGEEIEREIPFMKGYTIFNVEQIEDLPVQYSELVAELGAAFLYADLLASPRS
ncbi:uncharacterized protein DUF1738 [Nitrosospira multiformis]|uniref:Uncharacterized protein DUF1738 n=1 Tax=Nitrosospira multiformis TaxID=1231 RepID=A0A2T5IH59_9PROT|nr:ArdC-like ssDNA-binding domain-containing protein [Nitrosospira multiformis]PTQ83156.1 uncharacterized protein DUF1738 [Nitrosospira multiformis]